MSETKSEVKTVGHSEKFSLTSEISLASENLAMSNSENFLNFLIFLKFL